MGSHWPWPIATLPNDLLLLLLHMSRHPMDSHWPWPIAILPNDLLLLLCTCPVIPRAAIGPGPLQYFQMSSSCCCICTCPFIPWTAIGSGPLQHFQMSSSCCTKHMSIHPMDSHWPWPIATLPNALLWLLHHTLFIPWAAIGPGPLQHFQMPSCCCISTCPFIPWAAIGPGPLQHFQMTSSAACTCSFIPWAAIGPGPLQYFQMTSSCCLLTDVFIQCRGSFLHNKLQTRQSTFHGKEPTNFLLSLSAMRGGLLEAVVPSPAHPVADHLPWSC